MGLGLAFIQPDNFCLLIGMFRLLTFNVIIDEVTFAYASSYLFSVCPVGGCFLFLSKQ